MEQIKLSFQDLEVKYLKAHNDSLKRQCESSKMNEKNNEILQQTIQDLNNQIEVMKIEFDQEKEASHKFQKELESLKQEKDEQKQQYFVDREALDSENEHLWEEINLLKSLEEKVWKQIQAKDKQFEDKMEVLMAQSKVFEKELDEERKKCASLNLKV